MGVKAYFVSPTRLVTFRTFIGCGFAWGSVADIVRIVGVTY